MLLAVQRGHPQALTELGLHHLHFDQVESTPLPLDLTKAAQNLTPGALAGDSLALMGLGLTYQKTKELPNRFKLHLTAANNGDQPLAQLIARTPRGEPQLVRSLCACARICLCVRGVQEMERQAWQSRARACNARRVESVSKPFKKPRPAKETPSSVLQLTTTENKEYVPSPASLRTVSETEDEQDNPHMNIPLDEQLRWSSSDSEGDEVSIA